MAVLRQPAVAHLPMPEKVLEDVEGMLHEGPEKEALKAVEKAKASVRAFVEHPFHILKNIFRHRKVRYRGLAKNGHQLHTLFGLANLVMAARRTTA